jgi:hypothetical protein
MSCFKQKCVDALRDLYGDFTKDPQFVQFSVEDNLGFQSLNLKFAGVSYISFNRIGDQGDVLVEYSLKDNFIAQSIPNYDSTFTGHCSSNPIFVVCDDIRTSTAGEIDELKINFFGYVV